MFNDSVSEDIFACEGYTIPKLYKLPNASTHM